MNIFNTVADFNAAPNTLEKQAFLQAMLDDYITFDDAEYPEEYDNNLREGDEGYVAPVFRKEWNAGAAAAWGFSSKEQIEVALNG
tara:strand:+ start:443 stop:697 length:255 start_codon:yes stop_codon:yes gene_type:complete